MAEQTRTIKTDILARVEGEGAMFVKIEDGRVTDVKLRIYDPPGSSKRSCVAARSPRRLTSRRASAASVPWRIR